MAILAFFAIHADALPQRPADHDAYAGSDRADYPYVCPTPGAITICAYDMCEANVLPDRKEVALYEDCGFNSFIQENGDEAFFDGLFSAIEGSGLKAIISSNALRGSSDVKRKRFIDRYRNKKNLGGWGMADEPVFDALHAQGKIYSEIYNADASHCIHFNIVGEPARVFIGRNTPNIESYLDTVRAIVRPGLWSFDLYPIKRIGSGPLVVDTDAFYAALNAFSEMSEVSRRPFWSCVLSMGFRQGEVCKPSPTEAHLRFAAFSSLAYGAQGIVYWTYRQRADKPGSTFIHLDAPVDTLGNVTEVWHAVREVNREIRKYNDVFYGAEVVDVAHTGSRKVKGARQISGGFGPFSYLKGEDPGMLVSHIRNSGGDYIVMVSHDVERSRKVELSVKSGMKVVNMSDGRSMKGGSSRKKLTLGKGGYLIFKYFPEKTH